MRKNLLVLGAALALLLSESAVYAVTFSTNTLITVGNKTFEGQDIIVNGCALTANGPHAFKSLLLTNAALLTHSPAPNGETSNQISLSIAGDLVVDSSSSIDASGLGYGSASGPGAGGSSALSAGSGGGHGGLGGVGLGGAATGGVYDSVTAAALPGSGGGNGYFSDGGLGGGIVHLAVTGTLAVNGGLVAANGNSGWGPGAAAGAGAGGTLVLTVGQLYGYGFISANGGAAMSGGGGGGGCVVINCASNFFKGTISAFGGAGFQCGGAGTVLVNTLGKAYGDLRFDNGGNFGQFTPLAASPIFNLTVANGAVVYPQTLLTNANLTLKSNGVLTCFPGQSALNLTVLSNAVIQPGGAIDVSAQGYLSGQGPGAGGPSVHWGGGGGGHGGAGAHADGSGGGEYDSVLAPAVAGSGGGNGYFSVGGSGGGSIQLSAGASLRVDGILKADGEGGGSDYLDGGGGAGGSLFLNAQLLSGVGVISANGGPSPGQGGGGGGGRIALYYLTNNFLGALTAYGGDGLGRGGAGTIFTLSAAATNGLTVIDNGGKPGGLTHLNTVSWPANTTFDLTVSGAGQMIPDAPLTFHNVLVTSGGLITPDPAQGALQIVALNDVRIDADGAINADGLGYGPAGGPGVGGNSVDWGGGGAGYGGLGGAGYQGGVGGITYGSSTQPTDRGSGGGFGYFSIGGPGGGAIRLSAGRIVQVFGQVTANGFPGSQYLFSGGGSGGSIFLTAGILSGNGMISANGAAAHQGGAGGGGRVAVYGNIQVNLQTAPLAAGGIGGDGSDTNRNGRAGSVVSSTTPPPFQVSSMYPTGLVSHAVSNLVVSFNAGVDASSFTAADVSILTPSGAVPQNQISVSASGGPAFLMNFPVQSAVGQYTVHIGPAVLDLYGRQMDQNGNGIAGEIGDVYTGLFTIASPGDLILPVPPLPPTLNTSARGASVLAEWPSQPGVQYQIQTSTDLLLWSNAELPVAGTGEKLSFLFDRGRNPNLFIRILASAGN